MWKGMVVVRRSMRGWLSENGGGINLTCCLVDLIRPLIPSLLLSSVLEFALH